MNYSFQFADVLAAWPLLLKGVAWTLALTAVAVIVGLGADGYRYALDAALARRTTGSA